MRPMRALRIADCGLRIERRNDKRRGRGVVAFSRPACGARSGEVGGACRMRNERPQRSRGGAWVRFHRDERGQAIYLMVLFLFLLAGLLFLVMNTGEKLNHKVMMQSAADAVTTTGAAWYARGLNTISMCNVTETQLLSLIVLLDTLETVVPPSAECIDDLMGNLGSTPHGSDVPIDDRLIWLVVGNARSEQQIIRQFEDVVRGIPMPEYLRYDSGVLWQCTKLMDGFSHAMARVTPLASIRESMDVAKKNGAEFGFTVPLWPELPVRDGQFEDWRNPMRSARMPPPLQRELIGGFAWVMGYYGYGGRVMGPWSWWREPFTNAKPMGLFDLSKFSVLFRIVSDKKFGMLFGETEDRYGAIDEVTLRQWEMDYDKAKELPPEQILRAWWETVSFDARYPFPEPSFFSNIELRHQKEPLPRTRSYRDMGRPDLSSYTRSTHSYDGADPRHAVWYRVQERKTAHYPQLGIFAPHPPMYPDGSPWPYTDAEKKIYYHVSLYRFNGAELETDDRLHRDYLPPVGQTPDLAPILLDRSIGDNLTEHIRQQFTFNGFAYRPGAVREWSDRFVNPNPVEDLVAYAEARVYNRWSWDLFTQHWKVKLVRTDRWKDLLAELDRGVAAGGSDVAGELTAERLEPVRKMLTGYEGPFVKEVTH